MIRIPRPPAPARPGRSRVPAVRWSSSRPGAPERGQQRLRHGLEREQPPALPGGEPHGAQPGQQRPSLRCGLQQGQEHGEQRVSGARRDSRPVDPLGARLHRGVDERLALLRPQPDGELARALRGGPQLLAVRRRARDHQCRGLPCREPRGVDDQEAGVGHRGRARADGGDPHRDVPALRPDRVRLVAEQLRHLGEAIAGSTSSCPRPAFNRPTGNAG